MSQMVFLVRPRYKHRIDWSRNALRTPAARFVLAFPDRAAAEAARASLTPPDANPFGWFNVGVSVDGGVYRLQQDDEMPLPAFVDWLHALGVEPPDADDLSEHRLFADAILAGWWTETAPTMTTDQRAAIWRWCDPEPYEIVEVELEETV